MPWVNSNSSQNSYEWRGLNTYNQHCAAVAIPSTGAITQLRVYASARSAAVNTRLAIWNSGGSVIAQSSTFSMAVGSESVGGQDTHTKDITATSITAGTYWVGLYRNPSGGHIFGTNTGGSGYEKTNTSAFPSISSMSGYHTDSSEPTVGVFYITTPDPTTSAAVSRTSDTRHTITWTNHSSSDQPYTYLYLERYDNVTGAWYAKATLSGSTTSYTDTSTIANRQYTYRVRAWNKAGYSSYNTTSAIRTTPAPPTTVVATRSGTSVVITWNDNATQETNQTIQRKTSTDNVTWSGWSTLSSAIAANAETYTDSSPANYNQYQVRADCTTPTLNSAYAASNVVQILQAPAQPTGLSPASLTGIDGDNANTFSWTHNSLDSTAQTKFSLEYDTADTFDVDPQLLSEQVSTDEFYEFAGATFTNNTTYYWRVKIWGEHATGSDWSETASFKASETPDSTITDPTAVSNYNLSNLTVDWTYTQSDSVNQEQYICNLYDENDSLLETQAVASSKATGETDTATFSYILGNNTTYKIDLTVKSIDGLWSVLEQLTFVTEFLEPLQPTIVVANVDDEVTTIAITNPEIVTNYTQNSTKDTYINATYSAANYNGNGQLDVLDDTGGGTDKSIILLDFDLSSFADDTIVSADLYLQRKYALTPGIDSTVNYIKTSWDETTVTYATIPTLDTTDYDDHTHSAGDSEVWDVATLVQGVADGSITDYEGMAIVATTTDGSVDYFYDSTVTGSEPELVVEISPRNAETSYNEVYRSVAGGAWELVNTNIPINTTVTDYIPNVGGETNYYAKAISATPTSKDSAESAITINSTGHYFLNSGNDFEDYIKLFGDTSFSDNFGRKTVVKRYHGRTYGVKNEGTDLNSVFNFSCDLLKTSFASLKSIIEATGDTFYRDFEGRHFKCAVLNPNIQKKDNLAYQFNCTIERVEDG